MKSSVHLAILQQLVNGTQYLDYLHRQKRGVRVLRESVTASHRGISKNAVRSRRWTPVHRGSRPEDYHRRPPESTGQVSSSGIGRDNNFCVSDHRTELQQRQSAGHNLGLRTAHLSGHSLGTLTFFLIASEKHAVPRSEQIFHYSGESIDGPMSASVGRTHMNYRGFLGNIRFRNRKSEIQRISRQAVGVEQPNPALTLVNIVPPCRSVPPWGGVTDATTTALSTRATYRTD